LPCLPSLPSNPTIVASGQIRGGVLFIPSYWFDFVVKDIYVEYGGTYCQVLRRTYNGIYARISPPVPPDGVYSVYIQINPWIRFFNVYNYAVRDVTVNVDPSYINLPSNLPDWIYAMYLVVEGKLYPVPRLFMGSRVPNFTLLDGSSLYPVGVYILRILYSPVQCLSQIPLTLVRATATVEIERMDRVMRTVRYDDTVTTPGELIKRGAKIYMRRGNKLCPTPIRARADGRLTLTQNPFEPLYRGLPPGEHTVFLELPPPPPPKVPSKWVEISCAVNYSSGANDEQEAAYTWVKVTPTTPTPTPEQLASLIPEEIWRELCSAVQDYVPLGISESEMIRSITGRVKDETRMRSEYGGIRPNVEALLGLVYPNYERLTSLPWYAGVFVKKGGSPFSTRVPSPQQVRGKVYYFIGNLGQFVTPRSVDTLRGYYPQCENLFYTIDVDGPPDQVLRELRCPYAVRLTSPNHFHVICFGQDPAIEKYDDPKHFFYYVLLGVSPTRVGRKGKSKPPRTLWWFP